MANEDPSAPDADGPPPEPVPAPPGAPPRIHERVVVIPTRGYWVTLGLSVLFLSLAVAFNSGNLSVLARGLYLGTVALALLVILIAVVGLSRRHRLIHRSVRAVKRSTTGVVEGVRARSDAHEGALERFIARWAKRFAGVGRGIVWLVKIPLRVIIWAWYTAEKLFWRILLILYDLVYYPLYVAWLLARLALRLANRIVWFALGLAWWVLRLPLYMPGLKMWWRRTQRPKILSRWRAYQAHRVHRHQLRLEKGRRLAAMRGENPDRWEADYKLRRAFPLPHPEKGRIYIRKRIAHITAVQRARKAGRPSPKWDGPTLFQRERKPKPPEPEEGGPAPPEEPPKGEGGGPPGGEAASPPEEETAARKRRLGAILRGRRSRESKPDAEQETLVQPAPA